jgi:hypothetical protein
MSFQKALKSFRDAVCATALPTTLAADTAAAAGTAAAYIVIPVIPCTCPVAAVNISYVTL